MAITETATITQKQLETSPATPRVEKTEQIAMIPGQKPWLKHTVLEEATQYSSAKVREIEIISSAGQDMLVKHPEVRTILDEYKNHMRENTSMPDAEHVRAGQEGVVYRFASRRSRTPLALKEFTYSLVSVPSHQRAVSTVVVNEALRDFLHKQGSKVEVPKYYAALSVQAKSRYPADTIFRHSVIMQHVTGDNFEHMIQTGQYNDGSISFKVPENTLKEIQELLTKTFESVSAADQHGKIPGLKAHSIPSVEWGPQNCIVQFTSNDPSSWKIYAIDQGRGREHWAIA